VIRLEMKQKKINELEAKITNTEKQLAFIPSLFVYEILLKG